MTKTKRLSPQVKIVVEDWKRRVGSRPFLIGLDCRQAIVAQCVMYLMIARSEEHPDRPMGDYVKLYRESCDALSVYLGDP